MQHMQDMQHMQGVHSVFPLHPTAIGAPAKDAGLEGRIQHPAESGWKPRDPAAEVGTEEFPGS